MLSQGTSKLTSARHPFMLALDQSTSATKALLFDEAGRPVDRESLSHRQHYPQPGWVEHDAEEIWANTLAVLRAVAGRAADARRNIAGLSITNQRETVIVFDRATGRPLAPALVWQDRRGDPLCRAQEEAGRGDTIHARTGLRVDGYFSASKIQWLLRHNPAVRTQLERGQAAIGTIDTYLVHRLTHGAVFATDHTNASRTLLFDLAQLKWDEELCSWWDVPRGALAEVRESSARFGETTLEGALAEPLPICGVMGDSQASLFAQRCFEPGSAKVTFGTGSSILLNTGSTPRFSQRGIVTALGWVLGGRPTYTFEGIIISSAATLTWLCHQLQLVRDAAEIERLASEVESTEGVYLVPAFAGLGLPYWSSDARAAIVGLSGHSDRRHVARAAVESIAFQVCDALAAMREESGTELGSIRADGGATANRLLMQFTADITRTRLRVASTSDCSPLGAAFAGMLGLGIHRSLDDLAAIPLAEVVYHPAMPESRARALATGWERAVGQVVSVSEATAAQGTALTDHA